MWPGYPSSCHIHSHYWAVMRTQTTLTQATAWHARCSRYGTSVRTLLRKGTPTKPLNAFIIRPFLAKDVLLPGREDLVDGARVRVSKLMKVDFDAVHKKLIAPALDRLHIAANTTEVVVEAGNIREDMFHLLMMADLVIADMTIHNPNVFYELGIRHAFRDKFTFLIRSEGNDDPFDLKTDRSFPTTTNSLRTVSRSCTRRFRRHWHRSGRIARYSGSYRRCAPKTAHGLSRCPEIFWKTSSGPRSIDGAEICVCWHMSPRDFSGRWKRYERSAERSSS